MSGRQINDYVRQNLRRLRMSQGFTLKDMASALGMPLTSYSSLEYGQSKITVSRLSRILGILNADIDQVLPPDNWVSNTVDSRLYMKRVQAFRLAELMAVSKAQGAALTRTIGLNGERKSEVLLQVSLSDGDLERVLYYLEDGRHCEEGLLFNVSSSQSRLDLFLKTDAPSGRLRPFVDWYLELWSQLFLE